MRRSSAIGRPTTSFRSSLPECKPPLCGAVLENPPQAYAIHRAFVQSLHDHGGIRIEGDLAAEPITNASFLAVGPCSQISSARPSSHAADSPAGNESRAAAR
jgi:hypothetical protein